MELNDAAFDTYLNDRTEPFGLWRLCPVMQFINHTPFGVFDNDHWQGEIGVTADGIAALHWFGLHEAATIAQEGAVAYAAMRLAEGLAEGLAEDEDEEQDEDEDTTDVDPDTVYGDIDQRFMAVATEEAVSAAVWAKIRENPALFGLDGVPDIELPSFQPDNPWPTSPFIVIEEEPELEVDLRDSDSTEDDETEIKASEASDLLGIGEIDQVRHEKADHWTIEFHPQPNAMSSLLRLEVESRSRAEDSNIVRQQVIMTYGEPPVNVNTETFRDDTVHQVRIEGHATGLNDLPGPVMTWVTQLTGVEPFPVDSEDAIRSRARQQLASAAELLQYSGRSDLADVIPRIAGLDGRLRSSVPLPESLLAELESAIEADFS